MRNVKEIPVHSKSAPERASLGRHGEVDRLVTDLNRDGIVMLPDILSAKQLRGMQQAFAARLRHMRWNNFEGYSKTEPYRHMIEDVLMLDQGFVDLALHPLVKQILNSYMGTNYALTEAKGWKSLPTTTNWRTQSRTFWIIRRRLTRVDGRRRTPATATLRTR